jgi:hypothetical protein
MDMVRVRIHCLPGRGLARRTARPATDTAVMGLGTGPIARRGADLARFGSGRLVPVSSPPWVAPEVCDLCPHPISEHVLWEPDTTCDGWMHCGAPDCEKCWHDWPALTE